MYIHGEQKLILHNCILKEIELKRNSLDFSDFKLQEYEIVDEAIFKVHETIIYESDENEENGKIKIYFSVSDENFITRDDKKRNYFELRNLHRIGMCQNTKEYTDTLDRIKKICKLTNKKIEPYIYMRIRLLEKSQIVEVYIKEVVNNAEV